MGDQEKMGSIGNAGFELFHAQNAFQQLVGPYTMDMRLVISINWSQLLREFRAKGELCLS